MKSHRWLFVLGVLATPIGFHSFAQDQTAAPSLVAPEGQSRDAGLTRTGARRTHIVTAVERVKAAVVNIHSERLLPGGAAPDAYALSQNRVNGMGTGIVIDPRGYLVTNQHVVEDVNVLRIRLSDGAATTATVIARHPDTDLALLKIDVGQPLPTIPLGTANDLMIGETVVAIGNAYGYEHTVSVGVVSAIKRDVSLNKEMSYKALIQTDASINPGNSGGPLVNVNGELVGVNVAIRAGAQGIGFAIPVDQMIRVVADMLHSRRRPLSYDGLTYRDRLELGEDGLVRSVVVDRTDPDSPASSAGLRRGDVLVRVGDVKVACSFDVERGLLERKAGDAVPVVYLRHGKEQRKDLVLQAPANRSRASLSELVWEKLGVKFSPVAAEQVSRANRQLHGGLEVTTLSADGLAAKAGIRKGDVLVGLHQWETVSVDNVAFVLTHPDLASFNPLSFYVVRGGQVRRGSLQIEDGK